CLLPLRALPSFPTRRSSDLGRLHCHVSRDRRCGRGVAAELHPRIARGVAALEEAVVERALRDRDREPGAVSAEERLDLVELLVRSEEHTSELQSRENLVCRL